MLGRHNKTMEQQRASSKDLRRLSPALEFLKPYTFQVGMASLALIVTAGATLSIGQGIRMVIDSGFASGDASLLNQSLLFFAGFVLVLTAGTFVRFYYVSVVGERVSADIRQAVFEHLVHMQPAFFEANSPSEIQSRITTDTTLLQTVIGSSVSIALRNVLMFFGGMVLLFVTNAKLSLIVLACVPLVVLPIVIFGRRVRQLSRVSQDRIADVGSFVSENFRQIKLVQSFNRQDADTQSFAQTVRNALEIALVRIWQRAVLIAVVMMLVFGAVAALVWVGGQDVLAGRTSPGDLAAFIFYAFIVAGSVGAISEVLSDLQRAAGATERLIELMGAPIGIEDGEVSSLPPRNELDLQVSDLSFSYPSRPGQNVLAGLNIRVEPGEMVALVGASGAGKSTLFDLLQRFYDPNHGRIALGGVDIKTLRLQTLRAAIGYVPQDPVLMSGSLLNNLRYANPAVSAAKVDQALEMAFAKDFVAALPEGLNTLVGEGGVGLSGGQKQRLAIARALLAEPSILLLDEATSALDAQSEQYIGQSVAALKGKMTVLVIAHRLSTVRQADRILVFENGALVGSGCHDELMINNDLYARFAAIQFAA